MTAEILSAIPCSRPVARKRKAKRRGGARVSRDTLSGGLIDEQLKLACQSENKYVESSLYWADLAASGAGAEPIAPDIVGEAFLLQVFQETGQDGPAAVLRAGAAKPGAVTRTLVRTIQDFASTHIGGRAEGSDDERDQEWALDQLTRILKANAEALNDDAFWQIQAALPLDTVAMVRPARDFYKAVVDRRDPAQSQAGLAALISYAIYEGKAGNRPMALAAATQAVAVLRELAAANPEAFLPYLALSHGAWGGVLLAAEEPEDAAAKFAEGIRLITPFARNLPEAHRPLAVSLAREYARACALAGVAAEGDLTWPLRATG